MRKAVLIIVAVVAALVIVISAFSLMDSDGDGLSNLTEIQRGTEFGNPDTDGDGLSDGVEVITYGTCPLTTDTDKDTLDDKTEIEVHGTNPLVADTDGDNLSDGLEITSHGTNPLSTDTDNDDLSDWSELFTHKTDPFSADTDNDNLEDYSEVNIYGADPLSDDSDNDRLSDYQEVFWPLVINGIGTTATSNLLSADSDGDNLTDWAEYHTYHSDPNSSDSDGDGHGDRLEVLYNTTLSESSSVPQLNENAPSYPSLFLEIDYMTGHDPAPEAISYIERYFENDLGVKVGVTQYEVTDSELQGIGVSVASISSQELSLIESNFHDNSATHLYVFYARDLVEEEAGGLSSPSAGVAVNTKYFPGRLDRERTILLHEIGHAFGLQHTTDSASAMQTGPTFQEPVYASTWSQRDLLDIWSVDEPWA